MKQNNTNYLLRAAAKAFIIFNLTLFSSSCEKMLEAYVGIPLQPTNINSVYEPGVNVFGLLKAGTIMDTLNHYFEVHFIPHVFDTSSYFVIDDAEIILENSIQTYPLENAGQGLYYNQGLVPLPGQEWKYSCEYDTFRITSLTVVPNIPMIVENSVEISDGSIMFSISYDTTSFMYDVYYIDEYSYSSMRFVPEGDSDIDVQMDIEYNENSAINLLYIIAYDRKYEEYITTSNIFFKPNAFRPRFTTVDGGFGCFGSLASLEVDLKYNRSRSF